MQIPPIPGQNHSIASPAIDKIPCVHSATQVSWIILGKSESVCRFSFFAGMIFVKIHAALSILLVHMNSTATGNDPL